MNGDLLSGFRLELHGAGLGVTGALELEALSEVMTLLRGAAVLADRDLVGVRGPDREVPRRDVLGVVAELQLIGVEGTYWVCDRLRSQTDQHEGSDGRCGDRQAQ